MAELIVVLRRAGADLEPPVSDLAQHTDRPQLALEEARRLLMTRLHRNPADFAATTALQAVTAMSAGIRSQIAPSERDRLVHAGLSNVERTRIWLRSAVASRRRRAGTVVRGKPRSSDVGSPSSSTDPRPVRALAAQQP